MWNARCDEPQHQSCLHATATGGESKRNRGWRMDRSKLHHSIEHDEAACYTCIMSSDCSMVRYERSQEGTLHDRSLATLTVRHSPLRGGSVWTCGTPPHPRGLPSRDVLRRERGGHRAGEVTTSGGQPLRQARETHLAGVSPGEVAIEDEPLWRPRRGSTHRTLAAAPKADEGPRAPPSG